jgi:hypothetical protein
MYNAVSPAKTHGDIILNDNIAVFVSEFCHFTRPRLLHCSRETLYARLNVVTPVHRDGADSTAWRAAGTLAKARGAPACAWRNLRPE